MTYTDNDNDPGVLAKVWAKLDLTLSRHTDALDKNSKSLAKMADDFVAPVNYRMGGSTIINAAGYGVVRLAGPDLGHLWHVMALQLSGNTIGTTVAGRADVFVTAMDPRTPNATVDPRTLIGAQDWRDYAASLPSVAFYGKDLLTMRMQEELFVIFSGVASGTQVNAFATILDIQENSKYPGTEH